MTRPAVLWVTEEVPDHAGGGGNQRQAAMLVGLAEHADIDLLVAGHVRDEQVRAATRTCTEVDVARRALPANALARRLHVASMAWLVRRSLDVWAAEPVREAFVSRLPDAMRGAAAVLVHHQGMAPLLRAPRFSRARWAFHPHNAAGDRAEQLAAVAPHRTRAWLLRQEAEHIRAVERDAIEHADVLIVATEEDGRRLAVPGVPTVVVPQGVDLDRFPVTPLPAEPTVLFAGSLDYEPNVDGITWFARDIWPRVRAAVPAARLLVVGRDPADDVRALDGRDAVEVHANVPDMAEWLAAARVAAIPLRVGTGVRIKALEALAAGRPVVGTSIALEGIPLGADDADVRDEPGSFADAVVRLLRDDALAGARHDAGRRFVEVHASWKASADALADALLR